MFYSHIGIRNSFHCFYNILHNGIYYKHKLYNITLL